MAIKDSLAELLAFLFEQDKEKNPISPHHAKRVMKKVKRLSLEQNNDAERIATNEGGRNRD